MLETGEAKPGSGINRRIAGAAGAALGLAALVGCGENITAIPAEEGKTPSITETTVSTSTPVPFETPSNEVTPSSIPTNPGVETTIEQVDPGNVNGIELLERTFSIEEMTQMTAEEYALKTTAADRAAYLVLHVFDAEQRDAISNDPAEPFNDHAYDYGQNLPQSIYNLIDSTALDSADPNEAAKINLSKFFDTVTNGKIDERTSGVIELMRANSGKGHVPATQFNDISWGKDLQDGFDKDGNPITYTNVTYEINAGNNVDLEGLGDLGIGETITIQTVPVLVETETGESVYVPMIGYTQDGMTATVDGAEY